MPSAVSDGARREEGRPKPTPHPVRIRAEARGWSRAAGRRAAAAAAAGLPLAKEVVLLLRASYLPVAPGLRVPLEEAGARRGVKDRRPCRLRCPWGASLGHLEALALDVGGGVA